MATTWSWLTAAAAWASRTKRLRAVPLAASCGGQHLDGHDAVQRRVERLEHDAHAAPADHLQHLVVTQPAELARLVRRAEETKRGDRRREPAASSCGASGSCFPFSLFHDLLQGRLGGGGRGQFPGQAGPGLTPASQSFHPLLAGRADFQVRGQSALLGGRGALGQEAFSRSTGDRPR